MGGGAYSTSTYYTRDADRKARGVRSAFTHSSYVFDASTPDHDRVVHEDLDPTKLRDVPGVGKARESRDSDDHPTSVAVIIAFDVTGSMQQVPQMLQQKLPQLMGMLLLKGVLEHPQVLNMAFGDATCDRWPLQIGQFESDNRLDENLEKIILEGGGGGQKTESYELALYFAARHTVIDCYEKRGHKGYLFLTGDETAYDRVKRHEVLHLFGHELGEDIPLDQILREAQEKYEVFLVHPRQGSYANDPQVHEFWRSRLGQNFILLDDAKAFCEAVAMLIASCEGIDVHDAASALVSVGSTTTSVDVATRAVSSYTPDTSRREVVTAAAGTDIAIGGTASVERL